MDLLPVDSAYAYPVLPIIMIVISLSSVIVGFQSMKAVTVSRGLDLKRLTAIGFLAQGIGLLLTIVLGFEFRSIWSYIAGSLVTVSAQVLLTHIWLHGSTDRLAWDVLGNYSIANNLESVPETLADCVFAEALWELKHFGKWIFASSGARRSSHERRPNVAGRVGIPWTKIGSGLLAGCGVERRDGNRYQFRGGIDDAH